MKIRTRGAAFALMAVFGSSNAEVAFHSKTDGAIVCARKQIAATLAAREPTDGTVKDFDTLYAEGRCHRLMKKTSFSVIKIENVPVKSGNQKVALIQMIGVLYNSDGIPDATPNYIAVSQLNAVPSADQVKKAYSAYLPSVVEYKTSPLDASKPPVADPPASNPKPLLNGPADL